MRRTGLMPAHMHAGPNMTPLVDVVMVILIFLMLAGSFGSHETAIASTLHVAGPVSPKPPPMLETPPQIDIHVYLSPGGAGLMQMSGERPVEDPELLLTNLRQRYQAYAANGHAGDVQVIIRPAANVPWAPVMAAYEAAARAEYRKVNLEVRSR